MTTTIYFYSGTGNSLVIARTIAQALGDTQILPIARYRKEKALPGTARVGIIFPIHAWGPPRTVEEFIPNLDLSGVRYTFAVASCGGTAAGTLTKLRQSLRRRGGDLHAGFMVRSKGYMAGGDSNPMIEMVRRLSGRPFPTAEERLPEIIQSAKDEKQVKPDRNALPGAILGNFFHKMAGKQFAALDAGYEVREHLRKLRQLQPHLPAGKRDSPGRKANMAS